jgi:hypothetical protein
MRMIVRRPQVAPAHPPELPPQRPPIGQPHVPPFWQKEPPPLVFVQSLHAPPSLPHALSAVPV